MNDSQLCLVQLAGLEPALHFIRNMDLNHTSLPIPPQLRIKFLVGFLLRLSIIDCLFNTITL